MVVKLGRALRPDEYRVKLYQLLVNDPEVGGFRAFHSYVHSLCYAGIRDFFT